MKSRRTWIGKMTSHYSQVEGGDKVANKENDGVFRTDPSFGQRSLLNHNKDCHRSLIETILPNVIDDNIIGFTSVVCMGAHRKGIEEWTSTSFDKRRCTAGDIKKI